MSLFADAFSEGLRYNCGVPDAKSDECEAYWDRRNLLALAGRATKPALDLILAGYYTESWAIERSMLEGWVRTVYLRLLSGEHRRFRSYGKPGECEPSWSDAAKAIRRHGDDADRALLEQAQLRWWFLNMGAHPSGEGIKQLFDDERRLLRFYPDPEPGMGAHALSHGIFVQHALLVEVEKLNPPVTAGWFTSRTRFADDAAPLIDSTQGALSKWSIEHKQRCLKKPRKAADGGTA
jgi:hypothetical protein